MVEGKGKPVIDLKRVVREVRIARAEQNDVVLEMRDAEQARLELLADALQSVADALPEEEEQLLLGILPGGTPRFWVDPTSFVMLGRDRRQFQFVKDTRRGRTVLAESTSAGTIADAVARYVAERIVEREQAIEADWLTQQVRKGAGRGRERLDSLALIWGLSGFGLGMIAGMFLLVAYAWFTAG